MVIVWNKECYAREKLIPDVGRAEQDQGKGRLPGIEQMQEVGKEGFPPDQSRGSIPCVCAKCRTLKRLL